jgi:hypothetical protein
MINTIIEIKAKITDETVAEKIIGDIRKIFKTYEEINQAKVPMIELIVK